MEKHQSYYMVIPAEVWDANISAKAMILYGHIQVLANKKKYCYATNSYFEGVMKTSGSTIGRAMKELEDNNLITRELIYKEGSKEIEERKIFLNIGMVKNDNTPVVKNDYRPVVTSDQDNSTSINKTRSNNKKYKKVLDKLVELYPKHRVNSTGPILKYLEKRTDEELKQIILSTPRYLVIAGDYVKNLRNYLEHECWTEEWLQSQQKTKQNKNNPNNADSFTNKNKGFYDE